MLIWLNLAIPVIAILLMIIFFRYKFQWWEYLMIFVVPCLVIVIAKSISISSQTHDVEQLNYHFVNATYMESYETYVHKTCTRCVETDTSGHCIREETYDCSTCDYNPPSWYGIDNNANQRSISESKYKELINLWHNESKIDLNRNIDYSLGCGKDGDKFVSKIPNDSIHYMSPITIKHSYENRIQCSNNVYNFQEIDSSDKRFYGLFDYPNDDQYNYNPILGLNDPKASKLLNQWNSYLGCIKRSQLLICVFNNKSNSAAMKQESYWKGGNKNEVVLCIGIDNQNNITWVYVFSWCENELLKIELRDNIKSISTLDMNKIIDCYAKRVLKTPGYIKRSFKQFSYIDVEPSDKAIIITFVITILITIGLCLFGIFNKFDF
jgi:hypothetical protein